MGDFDNFSGGFQTVGAMYDHNGEIKWHTASKTYDILASVPAGGPAAHASTHQNGGADEISVTGLSGLLADAQTPLAHNQAWSTITATPTTLAGYGITDASSDSELAAHESDTTNIHGIADSSALVLTGDPRLSDARTPTAHASSHQNGGTDEILVTGLSGLLADAQTPLTHNILSAHNGFPGGGTTFLRDDGTFAAPPGGGISDGDKGDITVSASGATWTIDADVMSAFARTFLDDADAATVRTTIGAGTSSFDGVYSSLSGIPATFAPSAHATSHINGGTDELNVGGLNGVLADPQPPIIGAGGTQAVAGNDARLTDARTPTAHATSHINGGSDELNVAGLNGLLADGQTPLVHNILTAHNGFPGGTATFLRADGTWAAAGGAASISSATVSLPYASRSHSVTITDASVSPASKIMPALGQCLPTDANEGDMIGLASMSAVAGTGDFVLNLAFDAPMGGPLKINYMLG